LVDVLDGADAVVLLRDLRELERVEFLDALLAEERPVQRPLRERNLEERFDVRRGSGERRRDGDAGNGGRAGEELRARNVGDGGGVRVGGGGKGPRRL